MQNYYASDVCIEPDFPGRQKPPWRKIKT